MWSASHAKIAVAVEEELVLSPPKCRGHALEAILLVFFLRALGVKATLRFFSIVEYK